MYHFRCARTLAVFCGQLAIDRTGRMGKDVFRCVECNEKALELHRDYNHGILKITICVRPLFTSCIWVIFRMKVLANNVCLKR